MSDTPRTDYAATLVQFAVAGKDQYEMVSAEFARQLERELNQRAALSLIDMVQVPRQYDTSMLDGGIAQLTEALKHPGLSKKSIVGMVYDGMTAAYRSKDASGDPQEEKR